MPIRAGRLHTGVHPTSSEPISLFWPGERGQDSGSPSQGVEGLTVPGYTGAVGSDSSPAPSGGEPQAPAPALRQTILRPLSNSPPTAATVYLERIATSPLNRKTQAHSALGTFCGTWAIIGVDSDGNRIAKRLPCGKEWCDRCRNIAHKRRISRVLPRLFQVSPMAYDVITFPLELRSLLHNPKSLSLVARKVRLLYRHLGYSKIYTRWHFFGDKSDIFHPHLNVLYDGGWLSAEGLATLKDTIKHNLIRSSLARAVGKDLVIKHLYNSNPKRIMHWVKYVTRATFLDYASDPPLAEALYGFHNGCFAGTWKDSPRWRLTGTDKKYNPLIQVARGLHPQSGKPLVWSRKPIPWVLVLMEEPTDIGAWWYLLPPIRAPTPMPAKIRQTLDHLEAKHRQAVRASRAITVAQAKNELAQDRLMWLDLLETEAAESEDCL